jgi:hypothetical protein
MYGRQMKTSRQPWQDYVVFFNNRYVSQNVQADRTHSPAGKR